MMTGESKNLLKSLQEHKPIKVFDNDKLYTNLFWDEEDKVYREEEWLIKWAMEFLIKIAEGKEKNLRLEV